MKIYENLFTDRDNLNSVKAEIALMSHANDLRTEVTYNPEQAKLRAQLLSIVIFHLHRTDTPFGKLYLDKTVLDEIVNDIHEEMYGKTVWLRPVED